MTEPPRRKRFQIHLSTAVVMMFVAGALIWSLYHFAFRRQEETELPKTPEIGYEAFDQRPGSGWRKVADEEKYLEAAKLIEGYEKDTNGLQEWQHVNLRFHAGQCYAFAGQIDNALSRFKTALYAREPADSTIRWNAYVRATIAFLERDRQKLTDFRGEIAGGQKLEGSVPNLDIVDRLIEHFDEPYAAAYRGTPKN